MRTSINEEGSGTGNGSDMTDNETVKGVWKMPRLLSILHRPLTDLGSHVAAIIVVAREHTEGDESEGRLFELLAAEQLVTDAKIALVEICDCFGVDSEGNDTGSNIPKSNFELVDELLVKMSNSFETLSDSYQSILSPFCNDRLTSCQDELGDIKRHWACVKYSNDMGPKPEHWRVKK